MISDSTIITNLYYLYGSVKIVSEETNLSTQEVRQAIDFRHRMNRLRKQYSNHGYEKISNFVFGGSN